MGLIIKIYRLQNTNKQGSTIFRINPHKDFSPTYTIVSSELKERIQLAVKRALPILQWAQAVKATAIQIAEPFGPAAVVSKKLVIDEQSVA